MQPTVMVLVLVLSFSLVKARLVGLEKDESEKEDSVAMVFQQLDMGMVPGEMLVHLQVHLSSASSIYHQEQGIKMISMNKIYILLER